MYYCRPSPWAHSCMPFGTTTRPQLAWGQQKTCCFWSTAVSSGSQSPALRTPPSLPPPRIPVRKRAAEGTTTSSSTTTVANNSGKSAAVDDNRLDRRSASPADVNRVQPRRRRRRYVNLSPFFRRNTTMTRQYARKASKYE